MDMSKYSAWTFSEILYEMLAVFDLYEKRNIKVSKLSGGYQRRCSFACALISNPKILFLDEPLVGIDITTNELILNFLKSINDMTIIFTTHSIKEAEAICDYVVFMDRGQKILEGIPKQLVKEYSKILGEEISIEFDIFVDVNKVVAHLERFLDVRNLRFLGAA